MLSFIIKKYIVFILLTNSMQTTIYFFASLTVYNLDFINIKQFSN